MHVVMTKLWNAHSTKAEKKRKYDNNQDLLLGHCNVLFKISSDYEIQKGQVLLNGLNLLKVLKQVISKNYTLTLM